MNYEEVKNRLKEAYDYLYETGKIHSVTELSDKMKRSRPSVSRALNGVPEYLNEKFLKSFTDTFQMISLDWLMTGNGDMFTYWTPDGVLDNPQPIDQSSLINAVIAAKDETIAALRDQLTAKDKVIQAKDELIAALRQQITILQQSVRIDEPFKNYPFEIGVAEDGKRQATQV